MKIAFLVAEFPKVSETFILNQVTGLIDLGHQVSVFTTRCLKDDFFQPDFDKYNLEEITKCFVPQGKLKKIINIPRVIKNNYKKIPLILESMNFFRYGNCSTNLKLLYALDCFYNSDFDVIHCHYGFNGIIGAYLKKCGIKSKVFTTFHGYDTRIGVSDDEKKVFRSLIESKVNIIAISQYNRNCLKKMGFSEKLIFNIPVGIDTNFFSPKNNCFRGVGDGNSVRFITVARLAEIKGIEYSIRAIGKLLLRRPSLDVSYRVVGSGPLQLSLRQLTKKLGLEKVVQFVGALPSNMVLGELQDSDVFILPSLAEALPIALMEAQSVGLPAIATDVGSVCEIIIDSQSGFIVPAKSIDLLTDNLELIINSRNGWADMGLVGRHNIVNKYHIGDICSRLQDLFLKTIN